MLKYISKLGIISVVMMSSLLLSSCSQPTQQSTNTIDKKTVTFHHYFSGSMSGGINQMIDKLNGENKVYDVKAIPIDHESYKVRIQEDLVGNSAADIYSYWAGAKTSAISSKLEDLDSIWKSNSLDKVFPKSIVNSATIYRGKNLMIPITQHFVGIAYNKKIFNELNLKVPKTWPEFLKICATLKSKNITPIALGSKSKWPAQFWFDYILLRTTPFEYRQSLMGGKASYTDPEVINSFKIWKNILDKGYFNNNPNDIEWDTGAGDMVYNGKAAMTLMGTWLIGYYSDDQHKWTMGKDYDFFEFPVIDPTLPGVSLGPIDGIVVPKNALNKKEALETMIYFTDTETQKAMSTGSGAFAPSQLVKDDFYSQAQGSLLKKIRKNPYWAFNYDLATPPEVSELGLKSLTNFLEFPNEYKLVLKMLQKNSSKVFNKLGK